MVESWRRNYRSTATILRRPNALIAHNSEAQSTRCCGPPAAKATDHPHRCDDEIRRKPKAVVHQTADAGGRPTRAELGGHGDPLSHHAEPGRLEIVCAGASPLHRLWGGLRFYDRREIKDMLAYGPAV